MPYSKAKSKSIPSKLIHTQKSISYKNKPCPVCGDQMIWLQLHTSADYHCETCAQMRKPSLKLDKSMGGTYYAVLSVAAATKLKIPGEFRALTVVYNLFRKVEEAKVYKGAAQVIAEVEASADHMTMMPQGTISRWGANRFIVTKLVM